MFKRIVCVLLMLTMITASTTIIGCGDDIKTDTKTEIKDVPIGEPQPVID